MIGAQAVLKGLNVVITNFFFVLNDSYNYL